MCHQNSVSEGEEKVGLAHNISRFHEAKGKESVQVENYLYNKNNRPNNNNNNNNNNLTILINN